MSTSQTKTMPQKGVAKASRLVERHSGQKMQRSAKKVSKMCSKKYERRQLYAQKQCQKIVQKKNSKIKKLESKEEPLGHTVF